MSSFLSTDAYKLSMARATYQVFESREEVFYLAFRKGGARKIPCDLSAWALSLLQLCKYTPEDERYLLQFGLALSQNAVKALTGAVVVEYAAAMGQMVSPREPILTLRGPSILLSWLEPLLLGSVSYMLQREEVKDIDYCCDSQALLSATAGRYPTEKINPSRYKSAVRVQCQKILDTGISPDRVFEVGLRSASCLDQHLMALEVLKEMGFTKTSNVFGAQKLGMTPVGTMGHEGVQRYNSDDARAYQAHMEAMHRVFFLLDTNDTLKIGMPTAIQMMKDNPGRLDGMRPDSGDLAKQFRTFVEMLKRENLPPHPWIFEDGLTEQDILRYESIRVELGYPAEMVSYGLGGFFICPPGYSQNTRDRIGLVYKLSQSGGIPTMKFGNELGVGKMSFPGIPVSVSREGVPCVAQKWELGSNFTAHAYQGLEILVSEGTLRLLQELKAKKEAKNGS